MVGPGAPARCCSAPSSHRYRFVCRREATTFTRATPLCAPFAIDRSRPGCARHARCGPQCSRRDQGRGIRSRWAHPLRQGSTWSARSCHIVHGSCAMRCSGDEWCGHGRRSTQRRSTWAPGWSRPRVGRDVTLASSDLLVGSVEATAGHVVLVPSFRNELDCRRGGRTHQFHLSHSRRTCSAGAHVHMGHGWGPPGAVHVQGAMCKHHPGQAEQQEQHPSAGGHIITPSFLQTSPSCMGGHSSPAAALAPSFSGWPSGVLTSTPRA